MINVMAPLMDSWQELIDSSISVPVFKEGSVPENLHSHYVELRAESESEDDTKQSFRSDAVVITDIVTVFNVAVDRSVAERIDNEIKVLLKSVPGVHNLQPQTGMQILSVVPESSLYFEEVGGGKKYYRKLVRYAHRIIQTT